MRLNWGSFLDKTLGLLEGEFESADRGFGCKELGQIWEHSGAEFKVVDTIAKTLSMKLHGNG